ncbi:hypothetical protein Emag_003312 [Eimeria magna]
MLAGGSSLESLRASPSYEPRLPSKWFELEWESGTSTSLQGRSRPPPTASHSSYLMTSYAVILLGFAVAYWLWKCFRSLHVDSSLGATVRALAKGGFPDEACTGESDKAGSDEGVGGSEADDRSGGGGSASSRGRGARRDEGPFQHRRSKTFVRGWAVQQMPIEWLEKTRRSQHKLKDLALKCALLIDILPPENSVHLVLHTAALAAVELAGFGHIPESVQGVRWSAGRAFVVLVERILKKRKLRMAAVAANCVQSLEAIRYLIKEVCGVPQLMEGVSQKRFKESLVRHWELNKRTTQHLGWHFDVLLSSSRERGSVLQTQYEMVMRVVKALLETRKMQLLGDLVLRRWLGTCHKKVAGNVLYTREQYEKAHRESVVAVSGQLQQITAAVVQAGGSPELPSFFSTFPSSSDTSSPKRSSSLISAEAAEREEIHQEQQQPAFSQEHAQAASSVGAQQQLFEGKESSLLASMRLVGRQEHSKPKQAEEYYTALGARPRRSASEEMQAAKLNEEAEALGWGPGRMPPQVATQVLLVLDRVERAANTCELIRSSLSYENAVLLSMNLARWAVTELASFSLVPSDIQEKRRRAAMRYIAFIDSVMSDANTCGAASHLGVDRDLVLLQNLFEEVTNPPPEPPDLDARSYMMVVMNAWRLSNFASRNVHGLLGSLWPTRNMRGTSRGQAQVVSPVIAALCKLRTSQLLADPEIGTRFVTCHQNLTPGLLYTKDEFEEARRSGPLPIVKELNRITKVLHKAQQSATAAQTPEAPPDAGHVTSSLGREQLKAPGSEAPLQQPSSSQPPVPRQLGRPKLGDEVRKSTSSPQTLDISSFGGHRSLPQVQQTVTRGPSRQQPSDPQPPITRFLRRFEEGEGEREPTSSPQTREVSTLAHRGPSTQAQLQLNPLAPEFSPRHLVSFEAPIAHTMEDPGGVFWSHPSTPATSAPPIDLPTIPNYPVPGWPDHTFLLAPAQPLEATRGPLVQISHELPPYRLWGPQKTSSFTHVRLQPHEASSASGVHSRIAYFPHPATSPLRWTHLGESFGAVGGEEVSDISGRIAWVPQGHEGGDFSDLTSQLSALGVFEEEEQLFED